ncbi:MAG: DUF975 family protein [Eubacterium sp.]
MFNRIELKGNAKKILSRNYWMVVVVTLIFGLVSGTGTGINLNFNFSDPSANIFSMNYTGIDNDVIDEFGNISDSYDNGIVNFKNGYREIFEGMKILFHRMTFGMGIVVLWLLLIVIAIAFILSVFVFNPLHVGCRRWYLFNRKEKAELGEIAYIFSHGYVNTVKIIFCKGLFTFLWSLLFVIPGIIKGYEYRMIPFLLAENPEMDMHEAFERSRKLMDGNKWDAFVLDLSFIGWSILAAFTCGILNLLYVAPYIELTNTELYVCLCQGQGRYTAESGANGNPYGSPENNTYDTY